jgi:hypothetical protein
MHTLYFYTVDFVVFESGSGFAAGNAHW